MALEQITPSISLTELAAEKIKALMAEHGETDLGLRIFVKGGGCSGLSYGMALDDPREDDLAVTVHGVRVFVDPMSLRYVNGSEVDYKEGFQGGGFAINNPNAVRTCGCGSSFHTADDEGDCGEGCDC